MSSRFLDAATFATMFRPLSSAEALVAEALLEVVAEWIRERKPDIQDDDAAALVVSFEVAREAMLFGKYGGLSTFSEQTGHRIKSGTIQFREIERFITSRHHLMLGLNVAASARGHFPVCDY